MHDHRTYFRTLPAAAAALLTLALAAGAGWSAPPPASSLTNPEITQAEVRAHVNYLASDELAGRGTGDKGGDLAAAYLAARFRAVGLKPGGRGRSYFQPFTVVKGVKLGSPNRLHFSSENATTKLKPGDDFLPIPFSGNGTVRAALVFVGYGISETSLSYDEYAGLDVKGKVVLILRYTPDDNAHGKFGNYAPLRYKVMTAREKGAAGVILITGPISEREENLGRLPAEGTFSDSGIPAVIVKREKIAPLFTGKRSLRNLQILMAHGQPQSHEVAGVRVKLTTNVTREKARARNVIGILRGSDPKLRDQYVVVGAHYDHLGMGGRYSLSPSERLIHYGADDNASGTAGVLELAQYFAAHPEKAARSIIFVGFTGEEIGLLGSAYFVKKPPVPLASITAMLNMDMIGRSKDGKVLVIGYKTSPQWAGILEGADRPYQVAKRGDGSGFGGSDHQSFTAQGIPVLFFFTGVHEDYHKPSDTADKLNVAAEVMILRFIADVTERIAALPTRPEFVKVAAETASISGFPVRLGTIPDYSEHPDGVRLAGVSKGGAAEKAGIRAGDVLIEFLGKRIRNVEEYSAVLRTAKPNVETVIVVLRDGKRMELKITPAPPR